MLCKCSITDLYSHILFSFILKLSCLGWPQTWDSLASASQIAWLQVCTTVPGCMVLSWRLCHLIFIKRKSYYSEIKFYVTTQISQLRKRGPTGPTISHCVHKIYWGTVWLLKICWACPTLRTPITNRIISLLAYTLSSFRSVILTQSMTV